MVEPSDSMETQSIDDNPPADLPGAANCHEGEEGSVAQAALQDSEWKEEPIATPF